MQRGRKVQRIPNPYHQLLKKQDANPVLFFLPKLGKWSLIVFFCMFVRVCAAAGRIEEGNNTVILLFLQCVAYTGSYVAMYVVLC